MTNRDADSCGASDNVFIKNNDSEGRFWRRSVEIQRLRRANELLARIVTKRSEMMREMSEIGGRRDACLKVEMQKCMEINFHMNRLVHRERTLNMVRRKLRRRCEALKRANAAMDDKVGEINRFNERVADSLRRYDDERLASGSCLGPKKYQANTRQEKTAAEVAAALESLRLSGKADAGGVGGAEGARTNGGSQAVASKAASVVAFHGSVGGVSSARWSTASDVLVTAGTERRIRLWKISRDTAGCTGVYLGSNSGTMSLDHDVTDSFVLAGSSDYCGRVWAVGDCVLTRTLTGHSGPVTAAKFVGEAAKVISGSYDSTIKYWDLTRKKCVRTMFASSKCSDLVVYGRGPVIISGHVDRTVNVWDHRSEKGSAIMFAVKGPITSLDLTSNTNYLLCCVKDRPMKLFDLRSRNTLSTFSHGNFRVGSDYTRAAISYDGKYVAAGSSNGSVFVWLVKTGAFESELTGHQATVTTVAWNRKGKSLVSADLNGVVTVWSDPIGLG